MAEGREQAITAFRRKVKLPDKLLDKRKGDYHEE